MSNPFEETKWEWLCGWLEWKFRSHNMYWHWGYWVWPTIDFRLNSSYAWGCSPYKSYRIGPFEYRRYQ